MRFCKNLFWNLTLFLNKAQFNQHSIDLLYVEDDGSAIDYIETVEVISEISLNNNQFLVPGNTLNFNIDFILVLHISFIMYFMFVLYMMFNMDCMFVLYMIF